MQEVALKPFSTPLRGAQLQMYPYGKEEVLNEYLSVRLPDKSICKNYFLLLKEKNNWGEAVDTALKDREGRSIPVEITSFSIDDETIFCWSVVKDLREKKALEEQILKAMINSEEQEKERYAKELHDSLGPYLSTALIYINTIPDEEKKELVKEYAAKANGIL